VAVIPHYDTFGERWMESASAALPADAVLLGIPERTAALWTSTDGWRSVGPSEVVVRGAASTLAEVAAPAARPDRE
jgi:hypothetical protein